MDARQSVSATPRVASRTSVHTPAAARRRTGRPPTWTVRQVRAAHHIRRLHELAFERSLETTASLEPRVKTSPSPGIPRGGAIAAAQAEFARLQSRLSPVEREVVTAMELDSKSARAVAVAQSGMFEKIGISKPDDRDVIVKFVCRMALDKIADALGLDD